MSRRKEEICSNCGKGCMLCFNAGKSHAEAELDALRERLAAAEQTVARYARHTPECRPGGHGCLTGVPIAGGTTYIARCLTAGCGFVAEAVSLVAAERAAIQHREETYIACTCGYDALAQGRPSPLVTKSGHHLTQDDLTELAAEAEAGELIVRTKDALTPTETPGE